MPVAMMDLLAAHQLKEALLCSLWRREREGAAAAGGMVTISLLGAGVSSLANQATGFLRAGVVPQRKLTWCQTRRLRLVGAAYTVV